MRKSGQINESVGLSGWSVSTSLPANPEQAAACKRWNCFKFFHFPLLFFSAIYLQMKRYHLIVSTTKYFFKFSFLLHSLANLFIWGVLRLYNDRNMLKTINLMLSRPAITKVATLQLLPINILDTSRRGEHGGPRHPDQVYQVIMISILGAWSLQQIDGFWWQKNDLPQILSSKILKHIVQSMGEHCSVNGN